MASLNKGADITEGKVCQSVETTEALILVLVSDSSLTNVTNTAQKNSSGVYFISYHANNLLLFQHMNGLSALVHMKDE